MSTPRNDVFWCRLFLSAAIFNWLAAASFLLAPTELLATLGLRPALEPKLYVQLFSVAVATFGVGYYLVSRDLGERRVILLGAFSKLAVFAVMVGHWLNGSASWHLPAVASVDFVYALFFLSFLRQWQTAPALGIVQ